MALQGTLDTFALPDVLRLLASTKKTGRLLVTGSRGTGSVWVDAGGVVGSEASGTVRDANAVDVLFELLRYPDGAFTFEAGTTVTNPSSTRAVEPLLVDAERLLAEWRQIEAVVPSMDAWVSLVGDIDGEEVVIAAKRWKTIVAIGSGTSVTGIGQTLELGELDVCRLVKELVELRLADVKTSPTPALRVVTDAEEPGQGEQATGWDPFAIDIPGVDGSDEEPQDDTDAATDEPTINGVSRDEISVVDGVGESNGEADEMAKQLASLSPKAARAVAAAAKASTAEEREAALAEASDDDEEPINRGLLLKFLSSVKS